MMAITIEKIQPADAGNLLAFLKQVGGETENLTFGKEGLPFTVEEEEAYLAHLENSCDEVMFVAKDGEKIVGNASLNRMPRRMAHRGDFSVAVAKAYWNRGIGRMLMKEIIAFAWENQFEMVDLQVRSDNLAAIHLYEKFGFQKLFTYPGFFKIDGQPIDFDYMCLHLERSK